MKLPCELVVWYLLPTIRKKFAGYLVDELNLTQKQAAEKLGLTESAISQYLKSKRGREMKLPKDIKEKIEKSVKQISSSEDDSVMIGEICSICKLIRNHGSLCELHRTHNDKLDNCKVCMGG